MRIDSYSIGMDSARLFKSSKASRIYGEAGVSEQGSNDALTSFTDQLGKKEEEADQKDSRTAKTSAEELADLFKNGGRSERYRDISKTMENVRVRSSAMVTRSSALDQFQRLHQMLARRIFELLFGDRFKKVSDDNDEYLYEDVMSCETENPKMYSLNAANFSTSGYYTETETTTFKAVGNIQTEDGRSLNINLNVSMSRSFTAYYETHFSTENLNICDPLVINYGGELADFESEYSFFFDLDTDGVAEKIAKLTSGSAFLALDLNDDGTINDGSELFGPKSGDGFKDLAAYDEDQNGWIDENDSVFEKLKLWSKDREGNDILYTLKQKDIGAIFLGAASTEFAYTDGLNYTEAYARQTGIFLYESGMAGTVQHIDMVS